MTDRILNIKCAVEKNVGSIARHVTSTPVIEVFERSLIWEVGYSTGRSIDGMIRAADANVATVTDKTIAIPGDGPIGNKSQLIEFRDMLVSVIAVAMPDFLQNLPHDTV